MATQRIGSALTSLDGTMTTASRGTRRVTLREVAATAGVSIKTASRVVNGEPGVVPDKVAAVRHAVAMLDYRPDYSASSLRRADRRTSAIGAVLEDLANPFSAEVLRALEDAARARRMLVLAGSVDRDPERERELVSAFSQRADALVIISISADHGYLESAVGGGVPVVFVDRAPSGYLADAVVADNRAGAQQAVAHLASRGHRKIAVLTDDGRIATARDRYAGFHDTMATLGLPLRSDYVVQNLHTEAEAEVAVGRLLNLDDPPTALFTARNALTAGAVRCLQAFGVQNQIALVGFDDFPLADLLRPGVTVMATDPTAIGRTTADVLFSRLGGDDSPPTTTVVRTQLIQRGSGEIAAPQRN